MKDHHLSQEVFRLSACTACGFVFTSPRPDQAHIGGYYSSDNYISHSNSAATLSDRLYQVARNWALRKKHRMVRCYKPGGRLLDVGCGTGSFLGYMQERGYQAAGVEPSDRARAIVNQAHPESAVPTMAELDRSQPFEVVTLWHVLEHLPDLCGCIPGVQFAPPACRTFVHCRTGSHQLGSFPLRTYLGGMGCSPTSLSFPPKRC
ncbi:MAG: class I SAM-dependent methyltransferase [Flavobacteriales bacterium]|nr:class I SAM-dependent methyltransferase [Flavobacteriales bacterium]